MKGSWRVAEAWPCVAGLESLKRDLKRLQIVQGAQAGVERCCRKTPGQAMCYG